MREEQESVVPGVGSVVTCKVSKNVNKLLMQFP